MVTERLEGQIMCWRISVLYKRTCAISKGDSRADIKHHLCFSTRHPAKSCCPQAAKLGLDSPTAQLSLSRGSTASWSPMLHPL